MARKYLQFYKDMWQGSMLTKQAEMAYHIITYCEDIPALRHSITDLTREQINQVISIDKYLRKNKTLEGLVEPDIGEIQQGTLEPYQTIGAAFMHATKGCLLGDEVGLGKTVQSAALCNILKQEHINNNKKPHRYLVLADKSAVSEIRDKMVQFTGEYVYLLPDAQKKEIDLLYSYDHTFDNVSIVGTHGLMLNQKFLAYAYQKGFQTVIFDEGKEIKNKNTMHENLKALCKHVENKYVLNATPLEISLRDMYNQLEVIDEHFLPYVGNFEKQYVKKRYEGYRTKEVGFKNEDEFIRKVSLRYIARTREQLGATYTANEYSMVQVPLSKEQKYLMTRTSLKSQVVDYPTSVFPDIPFNRQTTPKLDALLDILEHEVVLNGKKVIIYCRYREAQSGILEEIDDMGLNATCINGDTKHRHLVTEKLKTGEVDIIITSVFRSLDIGYADVAILYSINPNPQIMRQFEGRITRSFNVEGKTVVLLVSEGYELDFVETELKLRIDMSNAFTTTGKSMVFDVLEDTDNNKQMHQMTLLDEE